MVGRWGALLAVAILAVSCRKAQKPAQPDAFAAQVEPRAEENAVDRQLNAAQAEEAARRESAAREAARQQQAPPKLSGPRAGVPVHEPKPSAAPHEVLAAHEEIKAVAAPVAGPTAHATVYFKNDAGSTFRLVDARFTMDGADLPAAVNASAERGKSYAVFSGDVKSGPHLVSTQLTYQGASHGVFSYMNGYVFKVKSDDVLTLRGDQTDSFTIVGKERPGLNQPVEKRLIVTVEGRHDR
jgi:hypothetical protein